MAIEAHSSQPAHPKKHAEVEKADAPAHDASGWAAQAARDYGHHPEAYKRDLKGAQDYLEKSGLHGLTITGVEGSSLVGKDKQGYTHHLSGTGDGAPKDEKTFKLAKTTRTDSGHDATVNPDGSGSYAVNKNDRTGRDIENSIMTDRYKAANRKGTPTENELANLGRELERLNGKGWDRKLHDGDKLKIGASAMGQDRTDAPGLSKGPDAKTQEPWKLTDDKGKPAKIDKGVENHQGTLSDGSTYHSREKTDNRGMKEGLTLHNGEGTTMTIVKPDGSKTTLDNVYRTKTVRDAHGDYHIEYNTRLGDYSGVYTGDGRVKKFEQTRKFGDPGFLEQAKHWIQDRVANF